MIGGAQPGSPFSTSSLVQLSLSLLVIVALIFVISWALKRLRLAGPRGCGDIAVLDELAVGPRERIVLLRVGESHVLVGVCAGSMVNLVPLVQPVQLQAGAAPPAFADRLRDFMRRPGQAS